MTLRDEHLQQALRHAPDHDVAPGGTTRRAVLDYAAQAARPRRSWLMRLWQAPSWQLAGLSAAMAALLVVVVFWQQPSPDLPMQVASAPAEAFQRKADNGPAASASKPVNIVVASAEPKNSPGDVVQHADVASKAKEIAFNQVVPAASAEKLVIARAPEAIQPALPATRNEGEVAMKSAAEIAAAPPAAAPVVMAERSDALSRQEADKVMPEKKLVLDDAAKAERARVEVAGTAGASRVLPAVAIAAAEKRGAESAANDIRRGNLRILAFARSWPADKPLMDEMTGYKVELVEDAGAAESLAAEIVAYNQAMRQWHADAAH